MEGATAIGGRLIRTGQGVDALPVLVSLVGPDRLGDQDAAALPVMRLGMERDRAARAADLHLLAIGKPQRREVLRVDEDGGAALALP